MHAHRLQWGILGALAVCLLFVATCTAQPVWSIGQGDGSHRDLALFGTYGDFARTFSAPLRFVVGTSEAGSDWPGVHPGPADLWAGGKKHPMEVEFQLPEVKPGSYLLRIALVSTHGARPGTLVCEVGQDRRVVRLPSGSGDVALADPARGKRYHLDLPYPSSAFHAGRNVIRIMPTDSWVIWDSLQFDHVDSEAGPAVLTDSIHLEVLPLFMRRDTGLVQPAKMSMTLVKPTSELSLSVQLFGVTREYPVEASTLGTIEKTIEIPEIVEPGKLMLSVHDHSGLLGSRTLDVRPDRKWTIHVVPQAHVDIGYTDLQEKAMDVHRKSNDLAVELAKKYDEFSWSIESSYVLKDWLSSRSPKMIKDFFDLARSERIEIEAFYGNLLTGLLSDEEAFRSLYFSKHLAQHYGTKFLSATLTDAPSHIWSIPTVLRKSGIKYLSMGINQTRGPLLRQGLDKRSPVWWQGPDGSRIIAFFHDHYAWAGKVGLTDAWVGQYATDAGLEKAEEKIPWLLSLYDRPDYPYDSIHLHGAYGDNRPLTEQLPATVRAWNKKYAFPRIIFSTNSAWFEAIEKKYGAQLKTVSGDGGAFWEDGAASSAAETAINRQNQQQALLAEMLLTGLHAEGKVETDYRHELMDIWHLIMLYDEHTWGAHNSVSKPDLPEVKEQFRYKAQFAHEAQERLTTLLSTARHLIPPAPAQPKPQWKLNGPTLQTAAYQVTFDVNRGGISSIVDRSTGTELIDQNASHLCGQVIYARNEKPPYNLTSSTFESLSVKGEAVVMRMKHAMMPSIELVLRPSAEEKRLDLHYRIDKIATNDKEGVYIAFPFAGNKPVVHYAVANAVVRAGRDWLPGSCKDWFSVQNWVHLRNDDRDVVWASLDAPLINLQDINSNKWLDKLPIRNGHVYAYIMNNYWFTNYKAAQGGKLDFRFAITSDQTLSFSQAARFGRSWTASETNALERMISVAPDTVLISAFKRAEEGRGYIVRLREMSGRATHAVLTAEALGKDTNVFLANGVEDVVKELKRDGGSVGVDLGPWDVVTLRIE